MRPAHHLWDRGSRRLSALALPAPVSADQAPPVNVPGIDKPVIVVTGEVTGAETWVSTNYYVLRGAVFVRAGGTLNIQAGTRVIGESGSVGTLIVERGGRLNAIGTRSGPIVFTSDQPIGQRGRGDWGGIIINGRAPINFGGGEAAGEGDTGVYGGTDPNDNSGILQYVRVEFSGIEFSPDNELNGIAFQAVGRGTQLDYVQAHMSRDDAIELFGGTADVSTGDVQCGGRRLDWTFGWSGRAQFIAITQRGDDADNGIEADNNEFNNNVLPRSNPQIYNITACGDPAGMRAARCSAARTSGAGRRSRSATSWSRGSSRGSRSRRPTRRPPVRSTTARHRWARAWHGTRPGSGHAFERRGFINSGHFPTSGRTSIPGSRHRGAPTTRHRTSSQRHRHVRWRADGSDSAAERRLLRDCDVHRRGAAGAGTELDGRLDVVPSELESRDA